MVNLLRCGSTHLPCRRGNKQLPNSSVAAYLNPLAAAAADLRACPWMPSFRLVLRDLRGEQAHGTCTRGPSGLFTLTLHLPLADAYPSASVVVLCHEAAHALTWTARGQSDHGPAFGRAYARIWRALHPKE